MIHNALYERPRSLEGAAIDEAIRKDVEAVFHRAIHRDPDDRFETILDFVVALNQVGRPPAAAPLWARLPASRPASTDPPEAAPAPPASPPAMVAPTPAPIQHITSEGSGTTAAASLGTTASPTRARASTLGHSWSLTGRPTVDRVDWTGPAGFVELARLPPDIVLVYMSGVIESVAAKLFQEQLGPLLEHNPPTHVFWHLASIKTYPSDVRDASLRCLTSHRDSIESVHVLNGPGLVGMAVSLAAVALGGKTHVYEDQAPWRAALDAWLLGRRG
jgi:hypothetical protein